MTLLTVSRIGSHNLPLPSYAGPGDAGLDLRTAEDVTLFPGEKALIATGFAIAVPDGHVGLIHPRSGLAYKHGITVLNAPGTIDSGYRGEVKVLLLNTGSQAFRAVTGDRIAQLVIQEYVTVTVTETNDLGKTNRGTSGFGSTGVA